MEIGPPRTNPHSKWVLGLQGLSSGSVTVAASIVWISDCPRFWLSPPRVSIDQRYFWLLPYFVDRVKSGYWLCDSINCVVATSCTPWLIVALLIVLLVCINKWHCLNYLKLWWGLVLKIYWADACGFVVKMAFVGWRIAGDVGNVGKRLMLCICIEGMCKSKDIIEIIVITR